MSKPNLQPYIYRAVVFMIVAVFAASCRGAQPPQVNTTATAPGAATASGPASEPGTAPAEPTPYQPSPTPEPLAARVNGEALTLDEFQAELQRYALAAGAEPDEAGRQKVLDELIDQILLAQAAAGEGFTLSAAGLDARLASLAEGAGGDEALSAWMTANAYTPETFRKALARQAAAAWMRDRLAAGVPAEGEQVRVRQIRVDTPQAAAEVLAELQSGADFATLAASYDPVMEGELGWIAKDGLTDPAIETAAFALQAGEWSAAVETLSGVHILFVSERQEQRPFLAQSRLALQMQAVQRWLEQRRSEGEVEILSP